MTCTGRKLFMGCLLLVSPLLAQAGDNSLLVPAMGPCSLNTAPEDLPQAVEACQEVARQGDAQAQYELGELYYEGQRVPRDLPQAMHWFEQSSLQGNAQAQLRLGTMFFRGEGVQANNVQAYIVLKMAAVNGSDEAMDSADQVAERMGREELQAASQVLGQIFRSYLLELQNLDNRDPSGFNPTPGSPGTGISPQVPAFAPN
ncbi:MULTISPECIES: tetratricopeptide repeat protein [Pseudomonas]|uniref:tetratricopeptide repeat protein n=1 Tax=Pseudomonas TaxID=286 RepID=UPI001C80A8AD|nr:MULTISPECIES: tetratricopeptide repeat protein [Pseudomonas]MDG9927800.1 sel1 repeat family protein [Pseudomonas sp. GD04042]MDH0483101.1 sel1 repeat family protein [Pseudomonas sp. GD04015]MDH0605294.1 sel1 repeat family protein [Pseudomonas sp. GD03869]MDH0893319.1 sel1 repeat family protein [Pseudomonas sp. GD03875]MDH1064175.1 sel1 repeat family protein [Pseudomonas sp. GD03985]